MCCTWGCGRVSGEGDIEGGLVPQRGRIHPSADKEAGPAAEQHPHHQQHPERGNRGLIAPSTNPTSSWKRGAAAGAGRGWREGWNVASPWDSPEVPQSLDGQRPHTAAGPTAVLVGAASTTGRRSFDHPWGQTAPASSLGANDVCEGYSSVCNGRF